MKLTKKQIIDKILSFNYEELARWVKSRLHGDDKYFPIYEGYETNLSEFLTETYENIRDEKFRDNFLEILDDLTNELWGYSTEEVKKEADYIYELLSLCAGIKHFDNTPPLYRAAVSGKFKGIDAFDLDLHQLLLTTLASLNVTGDCEFWIEQMQDDSNKYYANAAFYALLNRKYSLDILFRYIDIFIDRFKGEIALELGIQALVKDYGKEEIIGRFKGIDEILSWEQKEAVNSALVESNYDPVYRLESQRDPVSRRAVIYANIEKVSQSAPKYETTTLAQEKAIQMLRDMGYTEKLDRRIAGHSIDIFFTINKDIKNEYEGKGFACLACFFDEEDRKVGKNKIKRLGPVKQAIWNELQKESNRDRCDDLELIVISQEGFTRGAIETAKTYGIMLRTLGQLFDELMKFEKSRKKLVHDYKPM
jgi:hypothetical protein